jgi:hypothetical protein
MSRSVTPSVSEKGLPVVKTIYTYGFHELFRFLYVKIGKISL